MKMPLLFFILTLACAGSILQNSNSITAQSSQLLVDDTQPLIDSIFIEGNTKFDTSWYKRILPFKEGNRFDSALYSNSSEIIRDSLYSKGYFFAEVQNFTRINEQNSFNIYYFVYEGPVVLAGDIEIFGLELVKPVVVKRELLFNQGQKLTPSEILLSIRQIYNTGLFSYVTIEPIDTVLIYTELDSVEAPILIQVEEANMINLQIGGGYSSIEGLFGNLVFAHQNLFRLGHTASLSAQVSFVSTGAYLSYTYPWFLSAPVSANIRGYINRYDWDTYKEVISGATFGIGGIARIYNSYRIWTSYKNQHFITEPESNSLINTSITNTLLFGSSLRRDTRYSLLFPGNAIAATLTGELAGPWMSWSNQFFRIQTDLRSYRTFFNGNLITGSALYLGFINSYGPTEGVSPSELFRAGFGLVRPVRGYDEDEISPSTGEITGGRFALILNVANIIFPVYRVLNGEVFIDAGKIWTSPGSFSLYDLRWSAGIGLFLRIPSFPLRIDYGIKLDRNGRFDGNIYFALGYPF